jgi:hypothetical protein
MKPNKTLATTLIGLVLVIAGGVLANYFPLNEKEHYTVISAIVLVGLALTVVFMALLAIIYSVMGVENREQPLGLPEGSVRALLAFSLVLIFACLAAFLFGEINESTEPAQGKTLALVTGDELKELKANFTVAAELAKDAQGEARYEKTPVAGSNETKNNLDRPLYSVTYYPKANKDAQDFAKQIFTTLATIFVSVVSFYFGSSVTTSAAAAGAKAAGGPRLGPSQAALTNALADSHNAQAALEKAQSALDTAEAEARANPNDTSKRDAVTAAQKALDDAKLDLEDKQQKVQAAQKAAKDADPKSTAS